MSNKAVGMLPLVLFYCFVVNVDAAACPDAVLISPCVCKLTGDQVDMTCAGLLSLQSLSDIFGRTFPTTDMHSIIISGSKLGPLPSDVFKGKSFEMIQFTDNQLTSFDNPSIFSSSKTRLTSLILNQDADDWTFNFANVQGFDLLTSMQITGYNLLLSGTLSSTSLTQLFIQSDLITTLPSFGSLPNLSLLDLDGNTIETLPTNSFTGVNSLTEVYLGHNKLVSLPTGTLTLTSPAVSIVDLSSNLIDSFSTGWITGLTSSTSLQLLNNYITQLDRLVFEDIFKALLPSGRLQIDGNPLVCGCEVAWIVTSSEYLNVARDGRCVNGTRLTSLDPNFFVQNC